MADDAPRWLDADEQRAWILVSQMTMRLPSALESRMQAVAGLGYFEYLVLSGLSMAPGRRLHLKDVARYTGSSLSRLSNTVRRFEERGWARRETDPEDGRSTYGVLTDAGLEVVRRAAPLHVEEVRRLVLDPLTARQLATLGEASRRIVSALDPAGPMEAFADPE